jgi:uncharacterized protein YaaW (UPF0174 family)
MRKLLLLPLLVVSMSSFAVEKAVDEWETTTISDATIKKIQDSKFVYKKCVSDEMQKAQYQKQESRHATEEIVKQCENVLAKMREVYIAEKVPEVIADRHLKQMRLQTTRLVLQDMMFNEAARSVK